MQHINKQGISPFIVVWFHEGKTNEWTHRITKSAQEPDDIANFDLVVRHDHTIDQEFDHLPALGKVRLCQSLLKAFTECLDRGDGCARLVKLLTHMRQLPRLGLQVVALLDQLALPPLEFG